MKHNYSCKFWGIWLITLSLSLGVLPAKADASREFLTSCAYGTLAGTLVGVASLAFKDKPGENLNNIARGASLGLYGGILLGLYVAYGVPSEEEQVERQTQGARLWIAPLLSAENKLDGGMAHLTALQF